MADKLEAKEKDQVLVVLIVVLSRYFSLVKLSFDVEALFSNMLQTENLLNRRNFIINCLLMLQLCINYIFLRLALGLAVKLQEML